MYFYFRPRNIKGQENGKTLFLIFFLLEKILRIFSRNACYIRRNLRIYIIHALLRVIHSRITPSVVAPPIMFD